MLVSPKAAFEMMMRMPEGTFWKDSMFEHPDNIMEELRHGVKFDMEPYRDVKEMNVQMPYKQGQLSIFVGHTNVGKSYFAIWLLSQVLHKRKGIIYSAENRISTIVRWILNFIYPKQVHTDAMRSMVLSQVRFIKHARIYNAMDILEQFVQADFDNFSPDWMLIDPYNSLEVKGGHEGHYETIERFRIFTQQTGKSIYINCHTLTESQRKPLNQDGIRPAPHIAEVEGGVKFINKADDAAVIHRNTQATDPIVKLITEIHVGKIRNKFSEEVNGVWLERGGQPTDWNKPLCFHFKADWTGFDYVKDFGYQSAPAPSNIAPF